MPDIRSWSTTAADNDDADANINWLEGQQARTVNNSARAMMAAVRGTFEGPDSKYNGLEWWDFGVTPTRTGNATFTLPTTDYTAAFVEGRRLRFTDSSTLYGTVVSSSFGASVTTVTVVMDSGNLSASLTKVFLSPQMPTSTSAPALFDKDSYATTAGTSTAYTLAYTPKLTSLRNGATVRAKIHTASGATPTLAVDGLTAKTIVKPGNSAVAAAELAENAVLDFTYDSTLDKWAVNGLSTGSVIEQGLHSIWLDASMFRPRDASGPEILTSATDASTNKNRLDGLAFDASTDELAQVRIAMPKSWNEGTITFVPYWRAASGTGDVVWGLRGVAASNDDLLDVAFGTAQTSTDTLIATTDLHRGPTSSAITIAGTPAAEDLVWLEVYRDANDAGDTLAADAVLIGIMVYMTINASTDT